MRVTTGPAGHAPVRLRRLIRGVGVLLTGLGLTTSQTGLLLTLTLAGDTVASFYLTTRADRIGRRRMLIVGAILMALAGLAFASITNLVFLIIARTLGVISPSGNEVGPFLSIEQAALSHVVPPETRTAVISVYTLEGLALAQLAPGPLAAQLAMYLGWVQAGRLGATVVALDCGLRAAREHSSDRRMRVDTPLGGLIHGFGLAHLAHGESHRRAKLVLPFLLLCGSGILASPAHSQIAEEETLGGPDSHETGQGPHPSVRRLGRRVGRLF